jgi:3,4-dihydroxy 2-butanone 4-phosphate synthase/GTP cyclohydrolase II
MIAFPCFTVSSRCFNFLLQIVVVVDDEDRENEGDLIMAAELATPEAMAFIVKHGTGIVCVSMQGEDLDRLQLPLMVRQNENDEKLRTAFTVTVVCTFLNLGFRM